MAKIDMILSKAANSIKNGTLILAVSPTNNKFYLNNTHTKNFPTIEQIKSKYSDRFDNPSYYFGGGFGGDVNGGDVGDGTGGVPGIYDGGLYYG
jgi:hypothetical protein